MKYAVGMRYASIGLLEYFDAVDTGLERAIAGIYPDAAPGAPAAGAGRPGHRQDRAGGGQGLYDWSQKDADDFRRRKQSPYFAGVKEWAMPDVK